jgi:pimeloyl-ACP methyl ester carboxylesterase
MDGKRSQFQPRELLLTFIGSLPRAIAIRTKRIQMSRLHVRAGAMLCALAVSLAAVDWSFAQSAPAGDTFYIPPSPLPVDAPGSVIWTRALTSAAALPSAGRNLLVLYHSTRLDGQDVAVSGTLAIPAGTPPEGGWPLLTWTHGTTGMAPKCAPSRDTADGPEHKRYLSIVEDLLDSYVRRGYAVVATDYEGLGTPGTQAYLVGTAEARGALDIVRAAREIEPRIGTRYVVMGHSQGGQADLFTAAIGPTYAPEFTLLGDVAMAPASHMGQQVQAMAAAANPSPILPFIVYLLQSYAAYYPEVTLKSILVPQAIEHVPDTWNGCIDDALASGYWVESIPNRQFLSSGNLGPTLNAAAANDPGTLHIVAPTLLVQGTADSTVPPTNTDIVDQDLCRNGSSVLYRTYPDTSHDGLLTASKTDAQAWVDARFAGGSVANNCAAPPSAAMRCSRNSLNWRIGCPRTTG